MTTLSKDIYGRSVSTETVDGQTTYTVFNTDGSVALTIAFPEDWPVKSAYSSIEAMTTVPDEGEDE